MTKSELDIWVWGSGTQAVGEDTELESAGWPVEEQNKMHSVKPEGSSRWSSVSITCSNGQGPAHRSQLLNAQAFWKLVVKLLGAWWEYLHHMETSKHYKSGLLSSEPTLRAGYQHTSNLRTCHTCKFSGPTLDLLNQKPCGSFHKPCRGYRCPGKFENTHSRHETQGPYWLRKTSLAWSSVEIVCEARLAQGKLWPALAVPDPRIQKQTVDQWSASL